jgi:hypothetical protein
VGEERHAVRETGALESWPTGRIAGVQWFPRRTAPEARTCTPGASTQQTPEQELAVNARPAGACLGQHSPLFFRQQAIAACREFRT